jgi:hypothetical protein
MMRRGEGTSRGDVARETDAPGLSVTPASSLRSFYLHVHRLRRRAPVREEGMRKKVVKRGRTESLTRHGDRTSSCTVCISPHMDILLDAHEDAPGIRAPLAPTHFPNAIPLRFPASPPFSCAVLPASTLAPPPRIHPHTIRLLSGAPPWLERARSQRSCSPRLACTHRPRARCASPRASRISLDEERPRSSGASSAPTTRLLSSLRRRESIFASCVVPALALFAS